MEEIEVQKRLFQDRIRKLLKERSILKMVSLFLKPTSGSLPLIKLAVIIRFKKIAVTLESLELSKFGQIGHLVTH